MESRRLAPLLFTVFAALAFFRPMTTAPRTPGSSSAATTNAPGKSPEFPEGAPGTSEFPSAKDLVAKFLFDSAGNQIASSGYPAEAAYRIEFLIATVPDPISSRLPRFFDSFIESFENAAQASGYTIDRFALPWFEKKNANGDAAPLWHPELYDSLPGLLLFRDPQDRKLLLIFLVGETPTAGIHKQALLSALEQMSQFYPWDPKHTELPPGFPQVISSTPPDVFRIVGPSFSGSAVSLRVVLEKWRELRSGFAQVPFQIISGTATAIDANWISQAAERHESFHATVPPDSETLPAVACYIAGLSNNNNKIAILTEGNTAYGQNFTNQSAPEKVAAGAKHEGCGNRRIPLEILSLPFPMHISRLRAAANRAASQQGEAGAGTASGSLAAGPLAQDSTTEPREVFPSFTDLSVQSAELTLANLLSTIAREQYNYVGIVATDVRDVTFLAQEVRQHCPSTVLFTLNSDLLYAYPDVNSATRGMITFTPYPLFNLEQLWTYAYGGGKSRLQFSNQAAEGVYNATLALLGQDGKLVDYGKPLAASANATSTEPHKPSLWVTVIGDQETLPVRLLRWKDDRDYTYSPAASGGGM